MSKNDRTTVFLTSESPYPPVGAVKFRDAHQIRLLLEKGPVEVLCFSRSRGNSGLVPAGVRVTGIEAPTIPVWRQALSRLRPAALSGYSETMAEALRRRSQARPLLWVSRLEMAHYIPLARRLGYRIILDEHHAESDRMMDNAFSSIRQWHQALVAAQCAWYEEKYCADSDAVVAASDIVASRLQKLIQGTPVQVIPNSVDSRAFAPLRAQAGSTLFFSGILNRRANVEGLGWFLDEVMPRLRAAMRGAMPRVVVAGPEAGASLASRLQSEGVELRGNPDSLIPYLAEAAVVFIPIRSGDAAQVRILEAMAAGRPVVTTGKGAEGLVLTPSFDIMISDQADNFTSSIVRLLRDPALRAEIAAHAVRTIEERHDWRCSRPMLEKLLESIDD